MAREFLLPDPGEGIGEAEILEVHVSAGDEVSDGDPLFTVETDKAVTEIPASFSGRIVEVAVEPGDVVEVGNLLLSYDTGDGDEDAEPEEEPAGQEQEEEPSELEEPEEEEEVKREEPEEEEQPEGEPDEGRERRRGGPVAASPATRSLAKRLGVDINQIEGSGPEGRIEPGDVQAAAEAGEEEEPEEEPETPPETDFERYGPVEWVDLRGVRRASARHMSLSWERIPHVTHHEVADITELESLRRKHRDEVEEAGGRLTVTAFLVKAVVAALIEFPRFNASLDEGNDRIALKEYYNIGIAVATDDGLVVPVIRDADRKSLLEIAVELTELSKRMRSRERSVEEMQGGTFTITNPGGIGGVSFNPIINHPEVAILGAGRAQRVPVVQDLDSPEGGDPPFEVVPRLHLPLVLAFDHRVNDGADAARFMNEVVSLLESPSRLLLRG